MIPLLLCVALFGSWAGVLWWFYEDWLRRQPRVRRSEFERCGLVLRRKEKE